MTTRWIKRLFVALLITVVEFLARQVLSARFRRRYKEGVWPREN